MLNKINFVTNAQKLKDMAYGDSVYAWLLLHSHYDETEDHNYIYEKEFTFIEIGRDIHKTRQTVSRRLNELLEISKENLGRGLIYYNEIGKYYILPCFREFEKLDSDTVLNLFWLCGTGNQKRKEELIKTYAYLKNEYKKGNKEISLNQLIETFGHSQGHSATYERFKDILTTLQGAGLIKFRTDSSKNSKGQFMKTLYIYQVNEKASKEWLDKKINEGESSKKIAEPVNCELVQVITKELYELD